MSNSQHALLAIALGPVQDFIAASRKARDLWAGSDLLSDLSHLAAVSLRKAGATLIFPTEESLDQDHAVANKLLVISANPKMDATTARGKVQADLRTRWKSLIGDAEDIDFHLADAQIEAFLEWYAAWAPYDPGATDGPDCYKEARQRVERLLAGRKTLREFWPATGLDGQPKSSLDPSRESVIVRARHHDPATRSRYRLKGAEQLDAISLIKRLDTTSRFVSSSRVAIDPLIRAMEGHDASVLSGLRANAETLRDTDLMEPFTAKQRKSLSQFDRFPYDSQLFYATSPKHAKALIDQDPVRSPDDSWKQATATFLDTLKEFTYAHPEWKDLPAYFAVLRADGDRMGAALNDLTEVEDHRTLSTGLGAFASDAKGIVARHFGGLIYSGGDDVLAFLPLDTAIPCAEALRNAFGTTMAKALPDTPVHERPTLSVGIAIGHYAEHLQSLLGRSMSAERAAKVSRNALAIEFSAHSGGGEARLAVRSWAHDPLPTSWGTAVMFHLHDLFPDSGAYELETLRHEFIRARKAKVFASDEQLD